MTKNASEIDGEDYISEKRINILDTLTCCYLVHLTAIVGIFGNCVTLIVLCRIGFKDTSNIVLLSLAGIDLFFLMQLLIKKLACIIETFDSLYADIYKAYALCYLYAFDLAALLISISHIVVISLERFLAVFFPLRVSQWFTRKNVSIILSFVYVTWIIAVQPWFYSYRRVVWSYNARYNRTYPAVVFTEWYTSNAPIFKVFGYIIINSVTGFFCGIVTAISCAIGYKLHLLAKRRLTLTSNKDINLDLRISRMLLVVCVVYCFCNIPSFVIYFGFYVFPFTLENVELNNFLRELEEVLMAINCAADFFIYILMSSKFYSSVTGLFKFGKSINGLTKNLANQRHETVSLKLKG